MRGAAAAARHRQEAEVFSAWAARWIDIDVETHKKLSGLSYYLKKLLPGGDPKPVGPAALLAQFEALKASGIPMTIRKVP